MESRKEREQEHAPDDEEAPGAAPEESPSSNRIPALPADDDAPLGDTDQHSEA